MQRTLYIESIMKRKEGQPGWWYTPVSENAKYIFNTLEKHSISCEKIEQYSDQEWCLEIEGNRTNMREFIKNLVIGAAGVYEICEYEGW